MQCGLLHFLFRLVTYQLGTEADWTFLELFKLHFRGLSRMTMNCHALDQAFMICVSVAESHGKSHADSYGFTRPINGIVLLYFVCCMLTPMKMSRILLMSSTMTIRTIQKTMFIALAVLAVLGRTVLQSLFSPPIVRTPPSITFEAFSNERYRL